jgi:hypothetical protein
MGLPFGSVCGRRMDGAGRVDGCKACESVECGPGSEASRPRLNSTPTFHGPGGSNVHVAANAAPSVRAARGAMSICSMAATSARQVSNMPRVNGRVGFGQRSCRGNGRARGEALERWSAATGTQAEVDQTGSLDGTR